MEEHDYEREIIAEILAFWQKIPNSPLQELAENVEIPEAAKLWEKDAMFFYQRFGSQPASSIFQVYWDDLSWKYYRSIYIESRQSGTLLNFQYPVKCFRLQGLYRAFYEELVRQWDTEPSKTLHRFLEMLLTRSRNILPDLNPDELTYIKTAAKSVSDSANQDFWKTELTRYKYFREQTGFSENLAKNVYRLVGYGIITTRTLINFAKIGLTPYLLITSQALEEFEEDYCFFHVKSSKAGINFFGLAKPPIAVDLDWQSGLAKEIECLEIRFFSYGWNLSQLTTAGWEHPPPSLFIAPNDKAFGQITLDFHTSPLELWSLDALYLERVQDSVPKDLKGEIGKDGYQRLLDLAAKRVIYPVHRFGSIQLSSKLVILYCRGPTTSLDKLQEAAHHFPLFRILRGTDWILAVLKMPSTWLSSAETSLKDLTSQLPITNLAIDIDHRFAAERYLQFSKLWDPEKKTWVVWDS